MLQACPPGLPRICASATALPFPDGTFTGALCMRLLQHLPHAKERTRILAELRRVTDGPVLVSFFDSRTLQHVRRVLRRATGKTRSGRCAITRTAFARELEAAGLRPLAWLALRRFIAEQTLVLTVRR
jgi:ubiquinone/menaquinone biosynthesis C-methylase UbiE